MTVGLINAACGLDWDVPQMLLSGERAWNLKRAINNRLGLTRNSDKLPKAFFKPLQAGGAAGYIPPFEDMLSAYYAACGWDAKTGKPSKQKLKTLGLDFVVTDLWG